MEINGGGWTSTRQAISVSIDIEGEGFDALPRDESNLIVKTAFRLFETVRRWPGTLKIINLQCSGPAPDRFKEPESGFHDQVGFVARERVKPFAFDVYRDRDRLTGRRPATAVDLHDHFVIYRQRDAEDVKPWTEVSAGRRHSDMNAFHACTPILSLTNSFICRAAAWIS